MPPPLHRLRADAEPRRRFSAIDYFALLRFSIYFLISPYFLIIFATLLMLLPMLMPLLLMPPLLSLSMPPFSLMPLLPPFCWPAAFFFMPLIMLDYLMLSFFFFFFTPAALFIPLDFLLIFALFAMLIFRRCFSLMLLPLLICCCFAFSCRLSLLSPCRHYAMLLHAAAPCLMLR